MFTSTDFPSQPSTNTTLHIPYHTTRPRNSPLCSRNNGSSPTATPGPQQNSLRPASFVLDSTPPTAIPRTSSCAVVESPWRHTDSLSVVALRDEPQVARSRSAGRLAWDLPRDVRDGNGEYSGAEEEDTMRGVGTLPLVRAMGSQRDCKCTLENGTSLSFDTNTFRNSSPSSHPSIKFNPSTFAPPSSAVSNQPRRTASSIATP